MDFERRNADLKTLHRRNYALGVVVAVQAAGLLGLIAILAGLIDKERTLVVPPQISQSFWVTNGAASSSYLEQMGSFVAWLVLDVTPASIDWKKDTLLSYVEPSQHGVLKARQEVEAERLKRLNASTYFSPQQLAPNAERQQVLVIGRLRTLINGQETANEQKTYRVAFEFNGGRTQLKAFEEVSDARP